MQQSSHIYSDSQTVNMSRCRFSLGNDRFIEVTEWKGELRFDLREWKDDKPTKKGISLTLMRWKNWVDYLEYADQARTEKQNYKSSWRERLLYHHRGQRMYGYKAVLEASRRGDTYEKEIIPETPRIHCRQRTLNRNWKGLTRTRRGRTLLRAK